MSPLLFDRLSRILMMVQMSEERRAVAAEQRVILSRFRPDAGGAAHASLRPGCGIKNPTAARSRRIFSDYYSHPSIFHRRTSIEFLATIITAYPLFLSVSPNTLKYQSRSLKKKASDKFRLSATIVKFIIKKLF